MRILMLTITLPYLSGAGGGNLRQFHLIREISRRHEVWLVSAALPWEMEKVAEVAPYCRHLEAVPHRFRFRPPSRRWHYWSNRLVYLRSPFPFEVDRYRHMLPDFGRRVEELLKRGVPDILSVEQPGIAHWHSLVPSSVPRALVLYDVLTDVARLKPRQGQPWRHRLLDRAEWWKTRRYEGRHLPEYDLLVTASEADRRSVQSVAPGVPTAVVPNGVDTRYFQPTPGGEGENGLLFTGSLSHPPNEDGVIHFCGQVYPHLRAARPELSLQIVGRSPTARVRELGGRDGIVVTGEVPDVRPFLREAAVVVVPLRYGGGTRLKILEALAAGKAVVSTPMGAAGLEVVDGRDLVLAEEPDFAAAVLALLDDPERRAQLGRSGRALVEERYDWGTLGAKLEQAYLGLVGQP